MVHNKAHWELTTNATQKANSKWCEDNFKQFLGRNWKNFTNGVIEWLLCHQRENSLELVQFQLFQTLWNSERLTSKLKSFWSFRRETAAWKSNEIRIVEFRVLIRDSIESMVSHGLFYTVVWKQKFDENNPTEVQRCVVIWSGSAEDRQRIGGGSVKRIRTEVLKSIGHTRMVHSMEVGPNCWSPPIFPVESSHSVWIRVPHWMIPHGRLPSWKFQLSPCMEFHAFESVLQRR